MVTTTKQRLITADELFKMPDDGYRYELVRGELRKMAPPGGEHGGIAFDIGGSLREHLKANPSGKGFGETGFLLARAPDKRARARRGFRAAGAG